MNYPSNPQLSDNELVKLIQQGEKDQFNLLYARYSRRVFEKCYTLVKDKSTAEELVQEIFFKVYEKLSSFQYKSTFSTWLYAITYNHSIEYLRKKKKIYYPSWNLEHSLPEPVEESYDIDNEEVVYQRINTILDEVHPEEKAMLLMHYHDNIPVKMIMETFKISESAAKMRLKRARARVLYLYKQKFNTYI